MADRATARRSWLALCLVALGCGSARPPSQTVRQTEPTVLRYAARLSAGFSQLDVQLCFQGSLWGGLVPGRDEALTRLHDAAWLAPRSGALPVRDGRIAIADDVREGCLRYTVMLGEGGSLSALVRRVGEHLLASPNAWLWRPARRPPNLDATLTLQLPEGKAASLPWPRVGDHYVLDSSAFAFDSHAAFGAFSEIVVQEAQVSARATLLGALPGFDRAAAERWLRGALHIAAQSDGAFPAPQLQVIVLSQPGGSEPFGSVSRGGGASVVLMVPSTFDAEQLMHDWVFPHELSHLLLPFVRHEDAWLPEGLATYYQEVLRARAGVLSAERALGNIAEALRSAQREGTGRSLCEESRAMHQTHAYRAVYWGGAGHWLSADVALRQRSGRTLDQLLSLLRREARLTPPYSAHELLVRLDQLSDTRIFSQLEEHCERAPFPDFESALHSLGVDRDEKLEEGSTSALRADVFRALSAASAQPK